MHPHERTRSANVAIVASARTQGSGDIPEAGGDFTADRGSEESADSASAADRDGDDAGSVVDRAAAGSAAKGFDRAEPSAFT